ncbi:MAG: glycosyltransferase [Gammaproteobacteria bacterium]
MIVVVAPYSPIHLADTPNLGASRKIEAILRALVKLDRKLVLVNSAHNRGEPCESPRAVQLDVEGVSIVQIIPPIYRDRKKGKLLNLLDVRKTVDMVLLQGDCELLWLYNGYAFESAFSIEIMNRKKTSIVIEEVEDWHFSRSRGLNPKPLLDWFYWYRNKKNVTYSCIVNQGIAKKANLRSDRYTLVPGIVSDEILAIDINEPLFSCWPERVTVGYFGGLNSEKGADRVLQLVSALPENYRLVVTGAGPLANEFDRLSKTRPDKLAFYPKVSDETLASLMASCDVILNPHSSIEKMGNGVFPFKVIEAVATGRFVISTQLPSQGLDDLLEGVEYVADDVPTLARTIVQAKYLYDSKDALIRECAQRARKRFGINVIYNVVQKARNLCTHQQ